MSLHFLCHVEVILNGLMAGVVYSLLVSCDMIGSATGKWFAFVLALLFLVFRPRGLSGEKNIERV